ncbi:MAG: GDSL-type esterase/lipase family protein [Oscillospiraceae bacterium]|jgi:lysophospholipase L1-like esterase|nr:GDSL-type esterase/lipase family protein [Oscillospiraceae bacterium]
MKKPIALLLSLACILAVISGCAGAPADTAESPEPSATSALAEPEPEQTAEEPPGVLKVACVGDSITEGLMIANPAVDSYPAQLQVLLGDGYEVKNFGVSGRTLQSSLPSTVAAFVAGPYKNEAAYTNSLEFLPDIVLIMLGTNDAFWAWDTEKYEAELEEFVNIYRDLDSAPEVWLMTCPPSYMAGFDYASTIITNDVVPAINRVAEKIGAPVIDVYAALDGHSDLYVDGLHPGAAGAAIIAETVNNSIISG